MRTSPLATLVGITRATGTADSPTPISPNFGPVDWSPTAGREGSTETARANPQGPRKGPFSFGPVLTLPDGLRRPESSTRLPPAYHLALTRFPPVSRGALPLPNPPSPLRPDALRTPSGALRKPVLTPTAFTA